MKKPNKTRQSRNEGVSIGGNVNTSGGDITGRDHIETHSGVAGAETIAQAFAPIYAQIDALTRLSSTERADLQATTLEIQGEALKGKKADEMLLQRRLREVERMAPDILEVILATLANPLVGLGLVAKKITAKAADESGDNALSKGVK